VFWLPILTPIIYFKHNEDEPPQDVSGVFPPIIRSSMTAVAVSGEAATAVIELLSPFKSAGASVQSTTGRRAVHISLQGLYCSCKPVFCSHVTLTGYPLHSLVSPSLLLPCVTVCHHISTGLYNKFCVCIKACTAVHVRSPQRTCCQYHELRTA